VSYDVKLCEPGTEDVIKFDAMHDFRGGTYCMGGTNEAWLNITYNYSKFYYENIDGEKGIRWLYGRTGAECSPVLEKAIAALGTERTDDYWAATPGNAGAALIPLLHFARARPDGVFSGD
jgi:hypothetical protein